MGGVASPYHQNPKPLSSILLGVSGMAAQWTALR